MIGFQVLGKLNTGLRMTPKWSLVIGGVGLVKTRFKFDGELMVHISDLFFPCIDEVGYLSPAPFKSINHVIRYGMKKDDPEIGPVRKRYNEIETAIELDASELREMSREQMLLAFKGATFRTVVAVGRKYNLPVKEFAACLKSKDPDFPRYSECLLEEEMPGD